MSERSVVCVGVIFHDSDTFRYHEFLNIVCGFPFAVDEPLTGSASKAILFL